MLEAEPESGAIEEWSRVAKKGRVTSALSLGGWELTSRAGCAREFVRVLALASWGSLPATTKITFTAGILAALRRVSGGENLVVLLDREQTASLDTLAFAKDLEIVTRSKPQPSSILCSVPGRLAGDRMVHAHNA